jgi:serine/threonine protein kinase
MGSRPECARYGAGHGPADRAGFVVELWRRDMGLGLDVGALLARDAADSFLEHPAAPRGRLEAGARLGAYTLHGLIGAGGMGDVYDATDLRRDRRLAIKVLPPELACEPERRLRFDVEARAIASLAHPYLCAFYEFNSARPSGRGQAVDYLVMEGLEGVTLAERLHAPPGRLPLAAALTIATQVADALDEMHRQGIVHRDLKPANIMPTGSGARLFDFGLASIECPGAAAGTSPVRGQVVGTPRYMAPEQAGGGRTDARTDVYLLGLTLYEMVTGRRLFEGDGSGHGIRLVETVEGCSPPKGDSLVPPALERTVRRCLERDPARRWQRAKDLGDALRKTRSDGGRSLVQSPPRSREPRPRLGEAVPRRRELRHVRGIAGRIRARRGRRTAPLSQKNVPSR